MDCPNCGHWQPDWRDICFNCGHDFVFDGDPDEDEEDEEQHK